MTPKGYMSATDAEVLSSIGERLRDLRKDRGLTQDQAAARAGLARSTVSEAENGKNPTLHTLVRLLRVYLSLSELEGLMAEPESLAGPGAP